MGIGVSKFNRYFAQTNGSGGERREGNVHNGSPSFLMRGANLVGVPYVVVSPGESREWEGKEDYGEVGKPHIHAKRRVIFSQCRI